MDSDAIQILQNQIEQLKRKFDPALPPETIYFYMDAYLNLLSQMGQLIFQQAFQSTAKTFRIALFVNPINNGSFARFVQENTQGKHMHILSKTEKEGVCRGLIPFQSREFIFKETQPLIEKVGRYTLHAVLREGKPQYVFDPLPQDLPVTILTYPNGERITSDIDLTAITHPDHINSPLCDLEDPFGQLTLYEKEVVLYINQLFLKIRERFGIKSNIQLISHGPSSRFSGSKQSHLHFPMRVFLPNGKIEQFGDEKNRKLSLEELVERGKYFQNQKQIFPFNPKWELEIDKCLCRR